MQFFIEWKLQFWTTTNQMIKQAEQMNNYLELNHQTSIGSKKVKLENLTKWSVNMLHFMNLNIVTQNHNCIVLKLKLLL